MSDEEFNKRIEFLETAISKHPDNIELIIKHADLIALKIKCDIEFQKENTERSIKLAEIEAQRQSTEHTNNTNLNINANNNIAATQQNYNNNWFGMQMHSLTQNAGMANHFISNCQNIMPHIANYTAVAFDHNQNTNPLLGIDKKN
ncbi:hypothetical protein DND58_18155 [Pseudomonas syringae pv. pisi]|nr:hypothetical protein DND62_16720 [Pseudomonas syringae pv. pisi]PYD30138.1 hypothetical protein DND58_18155 [Pseudomonas syringae pv. pisi]